MDTSSETSGHDAGAKVCFRGIFVPVTNQVCNLELRLQSGAASQHSITRLTKLLHGRPLGGVAGQQGHETVAEHPQLPPVGCTRT